MALLPDRSTLSDAESTVSGRRRGNAEPQLQDGDRKVFAHRRFGSTTADKSAAYVDLGRAYEKDENLDKPSNRT